MQCLNQLSSTSRSNQRDLNETRVNCSRHMFRLRTATDGLSLWACPLHPEGVNLVPNSRTVLILDREVAFAFWLGQTLDQAGYDAFPAKSCEDATALLSQFQIQVDLLVVGSASAGTVAFAGALRRSQRQLKVLAAVGDMEEPDSIFSEADAVKNKPSSAGSAAKMEWLRTIESLLVK